MGQREREREREIVGSHGVDLHAVLTLTILLSLFDGHSQYKNPERERERERESERDRDVRRRIRRREREREIYIYIYTYVNITPYLDMPKTYGLWLMMIMVMRVAFAPKRAV